MLSDLLTMKNVEVGRITRTTDDMGGSTSSTSLSLLKSAIIYQTGGRNAFLSDRMNSKATHFLVTEPNFYDWNKDDFCVVNGDHVYNIVSPPDNVMGYNEIMVVGLEVVT